MIEAIMAHSGGSTEPIIVDDVFSVDLYTGNGTSQTITNGVDLSSEGGLVWIKARSFIVDNILYDSERGLPKYLRSNISTGEGDVAGTGVTAFNTDGFDITGGWTNFNSNTETYVSWTFRKAPKFFDVVTYTGDGSTSTTVGHSLEAAPKVIIAKRTDIASDWAVNFFELESSYTTADNQRGFALNKTNGARNTGNGLTNYWTDTTFRPGLLADEGTSINAVNVSGGNYIAYLFADYEDEDSVIKCGTYTGDGTFGGQLINTPFAPQFLLIKRIDSTGDWLMYDKTRVSGIAHSYELYPNLTSIESTSTGMAWAGNGFAPTDSATSNVNLAEYIYIAIKEEA